MAIEDWAGNLRDVIQGVEGIEQAHLYDELPGTLQVFPCAIILPMRGSQTYGMSAPAVALHQVQVTVYVTSQVLPEGYAVAAPMIKRVRDAIAANVKLGGSVSYCLPPDPPQDFYSGPGGIRYGDKEHLGIIFNLRVKEVEVVSVEA